MIRRRGIGNRLAPPRFLVFILATIAGGLIASRWLPLREAGMIGFDVAAALFLASCVPLFRHGAADMRDRALRNDANRAGLLGVTALVLIAVLFAIAAELASAEKTRVPIAALIVATLAIAWAFANMVYAMHYAHMFYSPGRSGEDAGGLKFPGADEPDYWDFTYFAFTLGMTFQTSDVEIGDSAMRRVATFHSLAAFVFNIGVLAFTINVLGG